MKIPIKAGILLFCCWVSIPAAQSRQERFDQANHLLARGKPAAALSIYRQLGSEICDWKIFFNAGKACIELRQYLQAKIYYMRAKKIRPFSPDINDDLKTLSLHFPNLPPSPETDFVSLAILHIEETAPPAIWNWGMLILSILINFLLAVIIRRKGGRIAAYGMGMLFLLFLLLSALQFHRSHRLTVHDTALIVSESAQIRSGPGKNNTLLFTLNAGTEVRIVGKKVGWIQIYGWGEISGWTQEKNLQPI